MRHVGLELDALFPPAGDTQVRGRSRPREIELPRIDGYDVESVIGRGGAGVVFKARQLTLSRIVALKMLRAGPHAEPQELARFRREADAIAALRHPNIVQVYDFGDVGGSPFFTMEFVEGGNLAERIAGAPQDVRKAGKFVATAAIAVQFAHKSGIVHRDLKPANILLTAEGVPKLTDFGLAQFVEAGHEFTMTGTRLGTPSYMAPEQALGKTSEIGPAADIYALGAVLYELLTGRPPFKGGSPAATERQVIANEPLPPSRVNAMVPRDLERICLKCLQKAPARRYASAQDLADDLHRFLDGKPVVAQAGGPCRTLGKMGTAPAGDGSSDDGPADRPGNRHWRGHLAGARKSARKAVARYVVENGIPRAYELAAEEKWLDAKRILQNAQTNLAFADSAELTEQVASAQADTAFAERLEEIRQHSAVALLQGMPFVVQAYWAAAKEYAEAFAHAKFDIDDPDAAAAKIRASRVRPEIIAALDLWAVGAVNGSDHPLEQRLLRIARLADPDPAWGDRFHDPLVWASKQKLLELAHDAEKTPAPIAAQQLAITGILLDAAGADAESVRLLRAALRRRPTDFWLNWEMGIALDHDGKHQEAATYFRIVLASRGENPWILDRLAAALSDAGQGDEAIELNYRAVALAPKDVNVRNNCAVNLLHAKRYDEAEAQCRAILKTDPNNVPLNYALGCRFSLAGQHARSMPIFRRVVEPRPQARPSMV